MALSDLINAFQAAIAQAMPAPGLGPVVPSEGATGVMTLSGAALGTFEGELQVLTGGPLGVATAKLTMGGAAQFGDPFTIPAGGSYDVPLGGGVLSGLTLGFSGTFTEGDSYTFEVSAAPTFRLGEEWEPESGIFPRVVWVPTNGRFGGTEDYAGAQNQTNSPQSLRTRVQSLDAHCWGVDYDRAELLMDQVINGVFFAAYGSVQFESFVWTRHDYEVNKLGREVVLTFTAKQPVRVLQPDYVTVPPPLAATETPEFDT